MCVKNWCKKSKNWCKKSKKKWSKKKFFCVKNAQISVEKIGVTKYIERIFFSKIKKLIK